MHPSRHPRRLLASLVALALVAGLPASVAAEEDVTAPVGTFTINDGSGVTNTSAVVFHTPATDDVAVTTIRVFQGFDLVDERPYVSSFAWTLPGVGMWTYTVRWRDAAGNSSSASATITFTPPDTIAPTVSHFALEAFGHDESGAPVLLAVFHANDAGGPIVGGGAIVAVRFRTNTGPFGPAMAASHESGAIKVPWSPLDPSQGGSSLLGPRTVSAQVQDGAGNWSGSISTTTFVSVRAPIAVTGDVRTGHVVTFTPTHPAPVTFPAGTVCWWEMLWGNDRSLYWGDRDQTFGSLATTGPPSKGYCGPWTVTLPWVPHRQFLVSHWVELGGHGMIDETLGAEPGDPTAVRPTVDSTSRHIKTSNLPLVYVLPEKYELIVGVPVTYRAYPLAGATITSKDVWSAGYIDWAEFKTGGSTFTFTPKRAEHITVCWGTAPGKKYQLAACYDPPARYRDTSPPNTTPPVQRIVGGTVGPTVPVSLTWSGTDKGWGIASYKLQQSINGGAWKTISLPKAKTTTITRQLGIGTSYRFRVRATDKAGNVGAWDYGPAFTPRAVSESSGTITYTKAWTIDPDPTALGAKLAESGVANATARYTFRGRDVAWLAERGPGHGTAKVYVDGKLIKVVDLEAGVDQPRRIVFSRHWSTVGTHTIRIVVTGTAGRPIVSLDGFIRLH
jgi:hypothetical protein